MIGSILALLIAYFGLNNTHSLNIASKQTFCSSYSSMSALNSGYEGFNTNNDTYCSLIE